MALAKAKRKVGMKKAYNELVYEDEIEGILDFHLDITIIQTRVMSHSCNSKING
jgi:hypothetical protein